LAFSYWIDKTWFLTKGKLAAVLIIPSSWGSQQVGDLYQHRPHQAVFWRRCRGLKKKKLPHQLHIPTSTWHQLFSGAVAGEKEDFCKGSFARTSFTLFIVLLYFIFACIVLSKTQKNYYPL
jgi:hypothetical protein